MKPSTVTLTVATQIDYTSLSVMDPFVFTDSVSSDEEFQGFNNHDVQEANDRLVRQHDTSDSESNLDITTDADSDSDSESDRETDNPDTSDVSS